MKVLIACEFSAIVRDAFRKRGHDAWSCDLLPTEGDPQWHIQGDVLKVLNQDWDLMIAHPPCTHLAVSGAKWFAEKRADGRQEAALQFVHNLMTCSIPKWCIENPVSIISTRIRKPDQIIQPWMFGHMEQKTTCLWLKCLSLLTPTNNVKAGMMALLKRERERLHYMSPGPDRWRERSRTFSGISDAMASQWG